jgi:hypothetical protein
MPSGLRVAASDIFLVALEPRSAIYVFLSVKLRYLGTTRSPIINANRSPRAHFYRVIAEGLRQKQSSSMAQYIALTNLKR